ncbi:MAG: hypothetical protein AAB919_02195 [Patescibacteria group bacterium]
MHTGWRTFLIFLIGLVAGLGASVLLVFYLFRSDAGQALVRSYMITEEKWPDVTALVEQSIGTTSPSAAMRALNVPIVIAVPKAYATQEYGAALNGAVNDLQAIASSTNELGPLLVQLNNQSLGGDFTGFFDLVVKAKILVAGQQTTSARLSQHLTALAAANQQTSDAITKSLTQALLQSGQIVPPALNEYLATLDQVLSGSVPSAALIQDIGAKAKTFSGTLAAFGSDLQKLLSRFGQSAGAGTPR